MNRSQTFSIYNKARSNKALKTLDKVRVDRALGYLLSKDQSWRTKYQPTVKTCKCQDHQHGHICKHMIACMIETKWELSQKQERDQALPAGQKPVVDNNVFMPTSNGDIMVAVQKRGAYDLHIFEDKHEFKTHMKSVGFDGTVVRPSKARGRKDHTIIHRDI